jgi:hypothetical protein
MSPSRGPKSELDKLRAELRDKYRVALSERLSKKEEPVAEPDEPKDGLTHIHPDILSELNARPQFYVYRRGQCFGCERPCPGWATYCHLCTELIVQGK